MGWYIIYPINKNKRAYKGNFSEIYDHLFNKYTIISIQIEIFRGPISHLILIWDSLKFYNSWQFVDQTDQPVAHLVPKQDGSSGHLSTKNKKNVPTKVISLKTMFIYLKTTPLFLYRL